MAVVMNRGDEALAFALRIGTQQVRAELPPRSIATYLAERSE